MSTDQDETFDASDAPQVKDRIKAAKQAEEKRRKTIKLFMSTEDGRKWFFNFFEMCRIYHDPFSQDALVMAHNCGEANIGRRVLIEVENADSQLYLQMLKENDPNANRQLSAAEPPAES